MIPLRVAVGFLLLGSALALVGATFVDLAPEHRVAIAGAIVAIALSLLGLEWRSNQEADR